MDYSEAEQLADLCQKVVYSELMNDVIKNVPEGPARKFVVKSVTKVVDLDGMQLFLPLRVQRNKSKHQQLSY